MSILSWIIIGIIAGALARALVRSGPGGILGDLLIGVIGALIGGFVWTSILHHPGLTGFSWHSFLVAFVGAIILLLIIKLFTRGSAPART